MDKDWLSCPRILLKCLSSFHSCSSCFWCLWNVKIWWNFAWPSHLVRSYYHASPHFVPEWNKSISPIVKTDKCFQSETLPGFQKDMPWMGCGFKNHTKTFAGKCWKGRRKFQLSNIFDLTWKFKKKIHFVIFNENHTVEIF